MLPLSHTWNTCDLTYLNLVECLKHALLRIVIPEAPLLKEIVSGWKEIFRDKMNLKPLSNPKVPYNPEPARVPQNAPDVQTIQRECLKSMEEMFEQFVTNLKQGNHVVQAVDAPSRAPIDKLEQHRGYHFAGTIKEKPEEVEYWLERITQIVTKCWSKPKDQSYDDCNLPVLLNKGIAYIIFSSIYVFNIS
ncbi:hypothetical protein GQ457_09G019160 [Hibiscus cannabinus]